MNSNQLQQKIEGAKKRALERLSEWLRRRFVEEMSNPKWEWDNGQLRDIIDTGKLRDSIQVELTPSGELTFTWPVPYALQVHDGAVQTDGRRLQARPWTKGPLEEAQQKFNEFMDYELQMLRAG